jgi:hypothetical protein
MAGITDRHVPALTSSERRMMMAKEYTITLHEPPATQVIREGMVQHLNQVAQEGWKMINVVKESGYYYFFWERD